MKMIDEKKETYDYTINGNGKKRLEIVAFDDKTFDVKGDILNNGLYTHDTKLIFLMACNRIKENYPDKVITCKDHNGRKYKIN